MKTPSVMGFILIVLIACQHDPLRSSRADQERVPLDLPTGFPALNPGVEKNWPTRAGVKLGERLFHDTRLSGNNTISCASCHQPARAFTDGEQRAIGIHGRTGLRNTPPIQNLAFMQAYNWDGNILILEKQALVPIVTWEEMNTSILDVIARIEEEPDYGPLFRQAFGDPQVTADRIFRSLAQFQYTLISANSKYDRVQRKEDRFSDNESAGWTVFKQKCASCHPPPMFTDQRYRNIGFPVHDAAEEAGRARVTGKPEDVLRFRVPSLRNIGFTAPYGSFGQFPNLRAVLDYFDQGVHSSPNLDPILRAQGNRIPLSESEKNALIAFLHTLDDPNFIAHASTMHSNE